MSPDGGYSQMPANLEAEQGVIGSIMLRGRSGLDEISDIISEASFFDFRNALMFRAILALSEHHKEFDPLTVGDFLSRKGYAEEMRNGAYAVEIASSVPSSARLRLYAEIVADRYLLRQAASVGAQITALAMDPQGVSGIEVAGQAQSMVAGLLDSQPCDVSDLSEAMDAAFQELAERNDRGEGMDGLSTGFPDWDDILGGLVPGVHFLAGRPKHGKSSLAQNVAEHVALNLKLPVHVVILEMSEKQYAKRVIASVGDVNAQRMRRGTLDDVDWAGVSSAVRKMRGAPLTISKPGKARIEHVCAQFRKQHAKRKLKLGILDYFQLIDIATAKGENFSVAIGRVSRALVNLAQELGIPLLVLSQLTREADTGRPKPSHLRDSGALEADAESVSFVYRDEVNNPKSPDKGTAEIIVSLNRNGPPGECRLLFRGDRYRFEPLPFDWMPERREPKEGKKKGAFSPRDRQAGEE
jgi:replicative DNA helicase